MITHPVPEVQDRPIHSFSEISSAAASKSIKIDKAQHANKEEDESKIKSNGAIEKSEYDKIKQINEIK